MMDQLNDGVANRKDFKNILTWRSLPALQVKLIQDAGTVLSHYL
jgi:hypothetical protein